jgi:hypothetical protein
MLCFTQCGVKPIISSSSSRTVAFNRQIAGRAGAESIGGDLHGVLCCIAPGQRRAWGMSMMIEDWQMGYVPISRPARRASNLGEGRERATASQTVLPACPGEMSAWAGGMGMGMDGLMTRRERNAVRTLAMGDGRFGRPPEGHEVAEFQWALDRPPDQPRTLPGQPCPCVRRLKETPRSSHQRLGVSHRTFSSPLGSSDFAAVKPCGRDQRFLALGGSSLGRLGPSACGRLITAMPQLE